MNQMDNKPQQPGPINMNQNNINMAGGATPAGMEHQVPTRSADSESRRMLDTYIYEYFIKHDMAECARAMLNCPNADVQMDGNYRPSPDGRPKKEGDMNGVGDDAMDSGDGDNGEDSKSAKNLPAPKGVPTHPGSFLYEWFTCFMDIYYARNKLPGASMQANAYVNNAQVCAQTPAVRR